ncbi:hypothetical protein AB0L25_38780 [Spirillospora sp. NPDC052242]
MGDFDSAIDNFAQRVEALKSRQQVAFFVITAKGLLPLIDSTHKGEGGEYERISRICNTLASYVANGQAFEVDSLSAELESFAYEGGGVPESESTYMQDILACLEGAITAASSHDTPEGALLEYAINPIYSSLCEKEFGVLDIGDSATELAWRSQLTENPFMAAALTYIDQLIHRLEGDNHMGIDELEEWGLRGRVLSRLVY